MDDLELIKQKINIVDLISEYLPLKKSGINYKALCPFHGEKTPSFMVSPERGIWRCFGCQKGGDIFKFLMEKEGMDFKEALDLLAKKAGVTLKRTGIKKSINDRLFEINQKAQSFFHYLLMEHPLGKQAKEYLQKRGLKDETIKHFGLGYAPLNWESLTNFLKKRGFSEGEIISVGLGVPSKRGCYDRFRGRVIFPLFDSRDKIIGFAGRILDKGEPKYINTPQTAIFDKSKFLFGLNFSKGEIREKKEAILVEGEIDMILSYQAGVKNVAASKGTALTDDQIESLKKYTDVISLCFDTDLAGDFAARRGIERADQAGFNIKVIKVEGAKDPAELILEDSKKWDQSVLNAMPIYDYYLESVSRRFSLKNASGKKAIFQELLPIWRGISDPMVKEHYIQRLAAFLQVKDELIRQQINKIPNLTKPASITNMAGKDDKLEIRDRRKLLEEYLISLLLHIPSSITFVPNFPETLFTQEHLRQIYVLMVLFLDTISFKGKAFKISEFVKTLPQDLIDQVDKLYLISIDEKLENAQYWEKELAQVVHELKKMLLKASLEKLSLEIKNAQEFDKLEALEMLNKRFRDLSVKLKNL
ncbi:DNA primase [Candidatus Daviesbacteria bacterium]|nr:DNA primase [Candidatus Daviesbacteria bacterium]